nr:hypothetical protein [Tanacetum cinerariifolium]
MMEHKHAFKVPLERSAKSSRPTTPRAGQSLLSQPTKCPCQEALFSGKKVVKNKVVALPLTDVWAIKSSQIKFVCSSYGKNVEFEKKVKIVRSDNALEFVKGQCGHYLESQGVVYQTSCVERHQQNGMVERKHRHILDCARADFVTTLLVLHDPMNFKEVVADIRWCTAMDLELKVLDENGKDYAKNRQKSVKTGQYQTQDWKSTSKAESKGIFLQQSSNEAKMSKDSKIKDLENQKFTIFYSIHCPNENKRRSVTICLSKQPYRQHMNLSKHYLLGYMPDGCVKCFSSWKLMEEVYKKLALGYVDRGNDQTQICNLKAQLSFVFHMKDLGDLSYFLGLEVCRSSQRIFISQDKYTKDVLKDGGILNNKPYKLPMDPNLKLKANVGTPLTDPEVYKRAIASDLAVQLKAYCDSYWTSCSMTRRSTTGYCILLGDIPIS